MTRYAVLFLALLTACSGGSNPNPAPQADPTISVFTAAPSTLAKGSSTKLVFAAQDADALALDNGIGDVTGKTEVTVSPAETTTYTLTASRGAKIAQSKLTVTVGPTPAAGFKLVAEGAITAGEPVSIRVTAVDAAGAAVPSYAGTVHLMSNDEKAELPADFTFAAADKGVKTVQVTFKTAGPHALVASGTVGGGMTGSFSATSDALVVRPGAVKELRLSGLPAETEAGMEATLVVSFVDAFGNSVTDYPGTLHVSTSDDSAPAIPDVKLSGPGSASAQVTFFQAGVQTVTVQDSADATLKASAEVRVKPSTAMAYRLSELPTQVRAGEVEAFTVTALDRKGNVAVGYSGKVHLTASDASAKLSADTTFVNGVASASVAFRTASTVTVTATELDGSLTVTSAPIQVMPGNPARILLGGAGPVTAGATSTLTATVTDVYFNVVTDYQGTVALTSTDAQAAGLASYTFTTADAGKHAFSVTLKTAGSQSVTVDDGSIKSSGAFTVSAADAASCVLSEVPASAVAGASFPARVTLKDAFGNAATGYTGTVSFTSTDSNSAAVLPEASAFLAQDGGSRRFSVKLVSGGTQTLTATDAGGITCNASISITPSTARLVVALPTDSNAGNPVAVTVTVKDSYGNALSTYAGTVSFTSTDTAAVLPGSLTFTGSEGGTLTASATFNTLGAQKLTATQVGDATVTGSASTAVHGFVYTDPTAGQGKVRLVLNTTKSNASVVQLDLVSNFTATVSGTTTARGGAYSAGMNLPLDTSRAVADSTLLVEGNTFNLGTAPKAVAAALPTSGSTAGVLYSGVSQKFSGAGAVTGDVTVIPGRIFYSVRLKLPATATVGTVFDGNNLGNLNTKFRAAVRSRAGEDVVSTDDFVLGKLEVR